MAAVAERETLSGEADAARSAGAVAALRELVEVRRRLAEIAERLARLDTAGKT